LNVRNRPLSEEVDVTGDDVALTTPADAEDDRANAEDDDEGDRDDAREVVEIMSWVVCDGTAIVYMVAVLMITVALTVVMGGGGDGDGDGGSVLGGGRGSSPLRTTLNGGGMTFTVAHFCKNQSEVDCRSFELQLCAKQGTA
jgi:hypothetical protein